MTGDAANGKPSITTRSIRHAQATGRRHRLCAHPFRRVDRRGPAVRPGSRIVAAFDGYAGRYAWHCHLAEHESNEMMRPFDVIS
jgi:FtsP/CotA-like multicopper oxidase with cupredoxin domain